jgi:hypothetical protein
MDYSLIGCKSGNSIRSIIRSTLGQLSPLTAQAEQFLKELAPRAYAEAMTQPVLSKVTVTLLWHREISAALTVRTTFSTLTQIPRLNGLMLSRITPDSPYFRYTIHETSELQNAQISVLKQVTIQRHQETYVIYLGLTSHGIIEAGALPLPDRFLGQCRERTSPVLKRA